MNSVDIFQVVPIQLRDGKIVNIDKQDAFEGMQSKPIKQYRRLEVPMYVGSPLPLEHIIHALIRFWEFLVFFSGRRGHFGDESKRCVQRK